MSGVCVCVCVCVCVLLLVFVFVDDLFSMVLSSSDPSCSLFYFWSWYLSHHMCTSDFDCKLHTSPYLAEFRLLRYMEESIDLNVLDKDVLRLAMALATMCRKWSLRGASAAQPWLQVCYGVLVLFVVCRFCRLTFHTRLCHDVCNGCNACSLR